MHAGPGVEAPPDAAIDQASGPSPATLSHLLPPALYALSAVLVYTVWLTSDVDSSVARLLVTDAVLIAAPSVAAIACWQAHRRVDPMHTGWAWVAAAAGVWALGSVVRAPYQLLNGGEAAPFPSAADVGYIGYAFFLAVGIARFPRPVGGFWARWRTMLDGLVIAASLLLASLVWVLGPLTDGSPLSAAHAVALAYPIVDVAVASMAITRCLAVPASRRLPWALLSAGLLVLAATDSLHIARYLDEPFLQPGGPTDIGWLVTFCLVALAGVAARQEGVATTERTPPGLAEQLVPYASIGVAVGAYLAATYDPAHAHYLLLLVPYAVLVGLRHVAVVADIYAVAHHLGAAVERRTSELRHREQWWQDLVQNLSDVVVVVNGDGAVEYCSPSATGLGLWPARLGRVDELWARVHPDDRLAVRRSMTPVLDGRKRQSFVECRLSRTTGVWGWFEVTVVGQLDGAALSGVVVTLHDVSERRQLTDRLKHQADHDALTGLPNRLFLMRRLGEVLGKPGGDSSALLLIDLDDFKVINDSHGHLAGDRVLEVIGRRLQGGVRESDTVARLGGDEFAVVMSGPADEVRSTADRLLDRITEPVAVGGRRFLVRASIGVVFAGSHHGESAESLLSHVDIALYEAKGRGKGGVVYIEGPEREAAATQVRLREQIAQPDLAQFRVVYQPVVHLASMQVRGVEALIRWDHPELGTVPPDEFIPMAEHGGSIHRLGWHVLDTVCRQLACWNQERPEHRLAAGVNVSIRQLDEPDFARRVLQLVEHNDLTPAQLVLEITEQSLARDFDTAVQVVAELRQGGVSVAVDDYGTGYSSLQYLDRFEADVVKIDRSFVNNLPVNSHTQTIVSSVMSMARGLGLKSVAEGIETVEQLEVVRELGCELGQGYLFSRPLPAQDVPPLLGRELVPAAVTPTSVA